MKQITALDVLLALATAALVIFLFVTVYGGREDADTVLIRVDDTSWRYSLDTEHEVAIPGPLGDTEVHIEDGHVHVIDSPCNSKICVAAGTISRPGEWIICLPNRVFISIEGVADTEEQEVDDVVF